MFSPKKDTTSTSLNVDQIMMKNLPKNEYDRFKQITSQYKTANEAYAEEILAMERKFRKSTLALTSQRSEFLKKIPNFWITCMTKHTDLKPYLDDEDVVEFLKTYLVDLRVVFAVDEATFGSENVKKYGRDGLVIMLEFKDNPAFSNQYFTKAIGKKTIDGTDVAFCEGTQINWTDQKLKAKFMGPVDDDECSDDSDDCDIGDAEVEDFEKRCGVNAGGENDMSENWFSFFKWWEQSADELDKKFGLDENGNDKFSRAIVDDLWSVPAEWYDYEDDADSDSDDSDEEEDDSSNSGEEEML